LWEEGDYAAIVQLGFKPPTKNPDAEILKFFGHTCSNEFKESISLLRKTALIKRKELLE